MDRKRSRGVDSDRRRRIAIAIAAKLRSRFPYSKYGSAYYQRGTSDNLGRFGASFKEANADQRALRRSVGYYGRGAYWGKALGGMAGGFLGDKLGFGELGRQAGAFLGDKGSDWLESKLKGRGSYTVPVPGRKEETNQLIAGSASNTASIVGGDEIGSLHVKKSEYIADIAGSNGFNLYSWLINPGNQVLFPWLSQVAVNYDEYEFVQLLFEYRSVTAALSTTSAQVGTVIMACNYNSQSSNFSNKQPMMEYVGAKSVQINDNLVFGVECDPHKNALGGSLYVTNQTTVSSITGDPKTFFLGNFQVAVNGAIAAGEIGELWVHYDLVLRKPKQFVSLGLGIPQVSALGTCSSTVILNSIAATTNTVLPVLSAVQSGAGYGVTSGVLTTVPTACVPSLAGSFYTSSNVLFYQLPSSLVAGTYRMTVYVGGATTIAVPFIGVATANITVNNYIDGAASTSPELLDAIFTINTSGTQGYTSLNNGCSLIGWYTSTAIAITGTATANLVISQINPSQVTNI